MDRKRVARWVGGLSVPVVAFSVGLYRGWAEYPPVDLVALAPGYETASWVNEVFGPAGLGVATGIVLLWAFFFIGPMVRRPV